ncbi:MAG: hypothetical protein HY317_02745 [Acidobacteria bacterium]|nr:hypothetical protein [Acidobacteriota bacterium]
MKTETRDRHGCQNCGKRFAVVYHQVDPDEPARTVSAACPHCQAPNRVPVASSAATGSEYWTERIGS